MNILDTIMLQQSEKQIQLLQYIATLLHLLFVPFLGILTGGTVLSLWLKKKAETENNYAYLNYSKELIIQATINKRAAFALGIIPLTGLVIIFAQFFSNLTTPGAAYLGISIILFIVGIAYVYVYRYSLTFRSTLSLVNNDREEISNLKHSAESVSKKSGIWGIVFLLVASYFYVAGITQFSYPNHWNNTTFLSGLLVSGLVIFQWIFFLLISFSLAGGYFLFMNFYWEGGNQSLNSEDKSYLSGLILKLVYLTSVPIPAFVLINLYTLSDGVLSFGLFALSFLSVVLILAVLSLLYRLFKGAEIDKSGWVFVLILMACFALIFAGQSVINAAVKYQPMIQAVN